MEKTHPRVQSPEPQDGLVGGINYTPFERPLLDALSCSINMREFHSLNAEEVEANLLAEEIRTSTPNTSKIEMKVTEQQSRVTEEAEKALETDLGNIFFKHDADEHIKLEFTCESEQIVEQKFNHDYFLDDISEQGNCEDCLQVEVYSSPNFRSVLSTDVSIDGPVDCMGVMEHLIEIESKLSRESHNNVTNDDYLFKTDDNSQLSNIMSDHNYTSQEVVSAAEQCRSTLEQNLINHILNQNCNEPSDGSATTARDTSEVTDFVKGILDRIHSFRIAPNETGPSTQLNTINTEEYGEDSDRETFLQNIFDTVVAEDAEEEEAAATDFLNVICVKASSVGEVQSKEETKINEDKDKDLKQEQEGYEAGRVQEVVDKKIEVVTNVKVEMAEGFEKTDENLLDEREQEAIPTIPKLPQSTPEEVTQQTKGVDNLTNLALEQIMVATAPIPEIPQTAQEVTSQVTEAESHVNSHSYTLPENCSEPMEHTSLNFEDIFDNLNNPGDIIDDNLESKPNKLYIETLEKLTTFAKVLYDDCSSFLSASTNIEDKLQQYIKTQFFEFKTLANSFNLHSDQSLQTESHISKRTLKKINSKNKRALLQSSDSSDSSASSTETTSSSDTESAMPILAAAKIRKGKVNKASNSVNDTKNVSNSCNGNFAPEYDDGVPLSNYIQSEIFETETFSNQSSMSPKRNVHLDSFGHSESESEGTTAVRSVKQDSDEHVRQNIPQSESDKENAGSKSTAKVASKLKDKSLEYNDDDEVDKEIERLININGLTKRTTYNGLAKSADSDKSKAKVQNQKRKQNLMEFIEDDIQKDAGSDESISESDEDTITETQYLARYNENLKQQLLNASSSDSEELDHSDDELAEALSDYDADDGNKSPLIDKFLKTFNIEESDDEPDNEDSSETQLPELGDSKSALVNVEDKIEQRSNSLDEAKKSHTNSTDNSDCELLNDHLLSRKRSKPKSLEKMLSEVDKRKKGTKIDEDLISLSSDSDSSDVETVDVEPTDSNSRIIKPMLRQDQLASETRKAQKGEADRIRRLEKKQNMMAKVLKENPEANKSGELILDYNEETKTFIKVHPDIVKHLKPHQVDGVKFMYDSCYGGVEALKKNTGSGCILAHCMGLGKTLQLIALLHTVISYKELKTTKILVLCPKSTVMNWADEIVRWLGPLNARNLKVFTFNDSSDINEKLNVLREWSLSTPNKAGCLLIGYEAFRTLVFYHSYKNRGNVSTARLEDIRDKVVKYLLQPGADLVVCDEGHIIKNSKSAISLAVAQIITYKRIVLTGTPIQNNLKEYYSMVNFIKPLFLGTEKEFANLYANPIKNGQHKDSSKRDIKVMKQRSFVLHKKLSKFVQRKEAELLKTFLPKKLEYVLFIPMTKVQCNLYEYILAAITRREENRGRSLITDYTCLRKIWTHPKVLEDAWKNATNQKYKRDIRKNQIPHSDDDQPDDIYDSQTGVMSVTNDWWRHLLTDKDLETILPSNKLRTMFEILRMSEEKGEKCLIFSAFVAVLNVVEHFFKKITNLDPGTLAELNLPTNKASSTWISGQDYYRLDGRTPKSLRHEMIKRFNSPTNKRARVFLISAKAGGQGINLTGANRVLILDTSWNPSNDQQNIFRIFRLGQKKNCYIYRLLAMGTMEEKVYSRSVTKQAMSFRVVDEQQIDRHYNMAELAELYTLTTPNYAERPMPIFPQDSILASLLLNYPDLVFKYHEHDSLLENKVEQELSEQEKADAWAAYERDLQLNSEIRGLPNMEELQNSFAATKMQNYLGALSGLDMQTLLNYSSLGQQTAPAPYTHSLLSQYNYPTTHQQYLDMLNLYRKYTQSTMGYPEMGKTLGDSAYNASAYAAALSAMQKGMSSSTGAMLSGLHGSGGSANPNPLSALGDLSMYGIGAPKNLSTSGSGTPSLPQLASLHPSVAAPSTSLHNNPLLQYKPLDSSFHNLYNYGNNYTSNANNSGNSISAAKSKFPNNAHVGQVSPYLSTPAYQPPPMKSPTSENSSRQEQLYLKPPPPPPPPAPLPSPAHIGEPPKKPPTADSSKLVNSVSSNEPASSNAPRKSVSSNEPAPTNIARKIDANLMQQSKAPSSIAKNSNFAPTEPHKLSKSATSKSSTSVSQSSKPNLLPAMSTTSNTPKAVPRTLSATAVATATAVSPVATNVKTSAKNTTSSFDAPRGVNMGVHYPKSGSTGSSAGTTGTTSMNMGIVYPNSNVNSGAAATAGASELLKRSNEMQIIPTSSPPGTGSVSKQFNAISPSISLTALRSNGNGNMKTFPVGNKLTTNSMISSSSSKNSAKNINIQNNSMKNNIAKQSNIANAHTSKSAMNSSSGSSSNVNNKLKSHLKPGTPTMSTTLSSGASTISPVAKAAAATAVITKTNAAAAFQNSYHSNATATPTMHQKSLAAVSVANANAGTAIKKTVIRKPQNSLLHGHRNTLSPISVTSAGTPTTAANISLATSQANFSGKQAASSLKTVSSKSLATSNLTTSATGATTYLTSAQLQKRASATATATTLPYMKNALNIRPIDTKQNSAGTGIFIIEGKINEKRVAIGAPTKSGGGTTITKIGPKKRKAQDISFNETKRAKKY